MPRVSTYRMAGHLATAFTIFSALVSGGGGPGVEWSEGLGWATASDGSRLPARQGLGVGALREARLQVGAGGPQAR